MINMGIFNLVFMWLSKGVMDKVVGVVDDSIENRKE